MYYNCTSLSKKSMAYTWVIWEPLLVRQAPVNWENLINEKPLLLILIRSSLEFLLKFCCIFVIIDYLILTSHLYYSFDFILLMIKNTYFLKINPNKKHIVLKCLSFLKTYKIFYFVFSVQRMYATTYIFGTA